MESGEVPLPDLQRNIFSLYRPMAETKQTLLSFLITALIPSEGLYPRGLIISQIPPDTVTLGLGFQCMTWRGGGGTLSAHSSQSPSKMPQTERISLLTCCHRKSTVSSKIRYSGGMGQSDPDTKSFCMILAWTLKASRAPFLIKGD